MKIRPSAKVLAKNKYSDDSSAPSSETSESESCSDAADMEISSESKQLNVMNVDDSHFIQIKSVQMSDLVDILDLIGTEYHIQIYPGSQIHIKLSHEQKMERKRAYRKWYRMQPKVQEKIAADKLDPEVRKKRSEYAKRPEVMERKKLIAKERRIYLRQQRQNPNSDYKQYMSKVIPPLNKKHKRKLEKKNTEKKEISVL